MGIRPMSAASDLDNEIHTLLHESLAAGLQPDQIQRCATEALDEWLEEVGHDHADDDQSS